jgi:hypothetical protein
MATTNHTMEVHDGRFTCPEDEEESEVTIKESP